jgi:endonuclease/exonuclease/phosphatase family metal-dependent hydrolase
MAAPDLREWLRLPGAVVAFVTNAGRQWVLLGLGAALLFLAYHHRRRSTAGFNYVDPRGPRYAGAWQGAPTAPPDPGRLRVVSFNIKLARDIDRALEALRQPELAGADILLLQEMDLAGTERISCALGRSFIFYPAALHPSTGRPLRPFGVAMLSPWPIADDRKLLLSPLSGRDAARKTAMAATVVVAGRPVRVVNVHLQVGLSTRGFLLELDEALVGAEGAGSPEFPLIVAGDFNTNTNALLHELAEKARSRGLTSALPQGVGTVAVGPMAMWQLDHILFAGLGPAGTNAALRGPRKGSDHFPIRADLIFQGPLARAAKQPPPIALPPLFCGEPIHPAQGAALPVAVAAKV